LYYHVKWVSYHIMSHPQVAGGGYGFQIWRLPANIVNK